MNQKAVIYHHGLIGSGGSEKITFEEEMYFNQMGVSTTILSFLYDPKLFNGIYNPNLRLILPSNLNRFPVIKLVQKILSLRKTIKEIKPDIILGSGEGSCIYLYFSTLFTKHSFSAHVPQTIFWDLETSGNMWDTAPFLLARYSSVFRRVYQEIRNSTAGHMNSLPEKPRLGFKKRIMAVSEVIGRPGQFRWLATFHLSGTASFR